MAALDERAANGTVRQDTSRENIFLCQGYAQLKRLEYAFYLGFSLEEEGYAPEIGSLLPAEDRFTGEERLIYALALLRGHSYQEFYTNGGTNDFRHMRPKEHYLEHLRRNLALTDNDALRRQLLQLADLGFLDQDNCRAAVDLLLRSRLTEATAFSSGLLQPPLAREDGWGGHRFSGRGICALNHTDTEESQVE